MRRENKSKVPTLGRMQMRHNDITNMLIGTWWPLSIENSWQHCSEPLNTVQTTNHKPADKNYLKKESKIYKVKDTKKCYWKKAHAYQHTYVSSSTFLQHNEGICFRLQILINLIIGSDCESIHLSLMKWGENANDVLESHDSTHFFLFHHAVGVFI